MVELHLIYVVLYAGGAALAVVVALVAWRQRAARGAVPIAAFMLGVSIWSAADAMMWYVPSLAQQVFWERASSLGSWMVPVAFLALAFDMARLEKWRTAGRIVPIAIVAFALDNIEWVNPGRLFDEDFVGRAMGPYTHFVLVPGPLYWAFIVFAYSLAVIALVIFLRTYLRASGVSRTQAATLLIGGLVPFVASVVDVLKLLPVGDLDLAPLAFLVTGTLWLAAILRGTLLEVLPLARDVLVEQMPDGMLVVDGEDLVVDANPTALAMLQEPAAGVIGKPIATLLGRVKGAEAALGAVGPQSVVLPIGPAGDSRYVELGTTPLDLGLGRPAGRLVTLHDATEERRAQAQAARLAAIVTSSQDAIFTNDLDGAVTSWNAAAQALFGYTASEMIGTNVSVLTAPGRETRPAQIIERMRAGERITGLEAMHRRKDGSLVELSLTLSPILDSAGDIAAVAVIAHDITNRKQAERELRQSEEKFAAAFKASPDLISITRMSDGTILEVNDGYERLLGYSRAESVGMSTGELALWKDPADREWFIARLWESGQVDDFETTLRRKDGSRVAVLDSARTFDLQGETCILSVVRDITERKRAEETIRTNEAAMREAQRIGRFGSFEWEAGTDTIECSDEFRRIYGFGPDDELPTFEEHLRTYSEESAARFRSAVERAIETGEPFVVDLEHMRQDGTRKWLTARCEAWRDESGQVTGVRGTVQDITELQEERAALVASEAGLREGNLRFERMVYGVSEAMGRIVEARDPYTQGHEVRVARLAKLIAQEMGLSDSDVDAIEMAGLVHDIGKLIVPAEILTKPGRLSDLEFALIKEHPEAGHRILQGIDFPWPIADIVLAHHERWDGSGYPNGLAGAEIMQAARVLAVADVVEAMASHRPYRPALGVDAAIAELAEHRDRYDPDVVAAFLSLEREGRIDLQEPPRSPVRPRPSARSTPDEG